MMAESSGMDDEVVFVSERPQRPILEYIDLLNENEDSLGREMVGEQVDREAQVTATLDRLARQVAANNRERAAKCQAFKEKVIAQQAHGRQELQRHPTTFQARNCVKMWLSRPGPYPGSGVSGSRRWSSPRRPDSRPYPSECACPVVNCGRVYDSVSLLGGHLKRFDHSPCDPTIALKGTPEDGFACVACGRYFPDMEDCQRHIKAEMSSPIPGGHLRGLSVQRIAGFACPGCCLLFSLRDECLQHMAAHNHFSQRITPNSGSPPAPQPIAVPLYAKKRLIALCKEVRFFVRCTSCRRELKSHTEVCAHLSVHCRNGQVAAEAAQTVPEVMRQLCAYGRCECLLVFLHKEEAEKHRQQTQHNVHVSKTVQEALTLYCHHHNSLRDQTEGGPGVGSLATERGKGSGGVARVCECGLVFPDESLALRHLLAANQIFHKCGVCYKEMAEASVTRLHMCRYHGSAHLSNFMFLCRRCGVDMVCQEDVFTHVSEAHADHRFHREQAAEDETASAPSATARPQETREENDVVEPSYSDLQP